MNKRRILQNTLLLSVSIFFSLFIAELILRNYDNGYEGLLSKGRGDLVRHHFDGLYSYDSDLGWVPSSHVTKYKWDTEIKTIYDGIRSNGNTSLIKRGPLIMTFGDSFTFGDEIADDQTWPAWLEKYTGYRVLNAGVSSYGLDQTVLRAQKLIPKYKPDIVIISFLFNALDRCSQSVRHGVPKPYFIVENDSLLLKNQPVLLKTEVKLDLFRKVFRHSYLVGKLMDSFFPDYWWKDTMNDYRYIDVEEQNVARLLLKRLDAIAQKNIRIIILVQGDMNVSHERNISLKLLLEPFKGKLKNIEFCNAMVPLLRQKEIDSKKFRSLFLETHMSSEGNAFIAEILKRKVLNRRNRR